MGQSFELYLLLFVPDPFTHPQRIWGIVVVKGTYNKQVEQVFSSRSACLQQSLSLYLLP